MCGSAEFQFRELQKNEANETGLPRSRSADPKQSQRRRVNSFRGFRLTEADSIHPFVARSTVGVRAQVHSSLHDSEPWLVCAAG
jgi:hypothetical protein